MRAGFLLLAAVTIVAAKVPNQPHPSIGIFSSPLVDCPEPPSDLEDIHSCVFGTYVRWLEAAGVRVVPMRWDDPLDRKIDLMRNLNGVLFAGGSLDVQPQYYQRFRDRVCEIVNVSKSWNAEGDRFVLWGTCQGFQMLSACIGGSLDVVHDGFKGVAPKMLALNFTRKTQGSRMYGFADDRTLSDLQHSPTTLNYHHEGVLPEDFEAGRPLGDFFDVTSTNSDAVGRQFVSTMEAKNAAIYGVQYHPEWPPFDWSDSRIAKSDGAVRVSKFVSQFLRTQLESNNHTFPTPDHLEAVVIARHPVSYQGYGKERFWVGGVPKATRNTHAALIAIAVFAAAASFVAGAAAGRAIVTRSIRRSPRVGSEKTDGTSLYHEP
uniref:folate gamma-glutamyl hydrolase n=1 Tax=Neobodo designis TaxID=312471 RepID=A0A7S1LYM2_NEODS